LPEYIDGIFIQTENPVILDTCDVVVGGDICDPDHGRAKLVFDRHGKRVLVEAAKTMRVRSLLSCGLEQFLGWRFAIISRDTPCSMPT